MAKDSPKTKTPFGPQGKTPPQKPAPAASEEDTPVTGTYVPKGVVTAKPPAMPLPEPPSVASGLAAELAEIGTLRSKLAQTERDLDQARAVTQDQSGQIAALREALSLANSSHEVTEKDIQKLHGMHASLDFARSRDGNSFFIALKGQRSQAPNKAKNFATFSDLLTFLRDG